jgi:hypothetical protein
VKDELSQLKYQHEIEMKEREKDTKEHEIWIKDITAKINEMESVLGRIGKARQDLSIR